MPLGAAAYLTKFEAAQAKADTTSTVSTEYRLCYANVAANWLAAWVEQVKIDSGFYDTPPA